VYFWRIDRLKNELRAREVPARDVLGYATALLIVSTLPNFLPTGETSLTRTDVALIVVLILITVCGLWAAYRANGGAEGRDFAGRLLAIGWVLGLRLMVLWMVSLPLLFIIALATGAVKDKASDSAIRGSAWTFMLITSLVFYWRLTHHLRDVRGAV
jgi:hypothetical protein